MGDFRKALLAILLAVGFLATIFSAGSAMPPIPASFYGQVRVNNANVPVGTNISAWINGVEYAYIPAVRYTENEQSYTAYSITIGGDDLSTVNIKEGGIEGDIIEFHIGDLIAEQTAVWHSGINIELALTAVNLTIPNINVTASLQPFSAPTGHSSTFQSYVVSGINLNTPVLITAPKYFFISTNSGTDYSTSLLLSPSSGSLPSTTIYVKFSPSHTGSWIGSITHSSSGAVTREILLSGTASADQLFLPLIGR